VLGVTAADTLVREVLDEMSVTDTVYHDLDYTRPLTAYLLDAISERPVDDRVLLFGPNVALAQALLAQGRDIEIWHVPGVAITENLRPNVTRVGEVDVLLGATTESHVFDIVVLPFVIDSAAADPAETLGVVRGMLAPDGVVIAAVRRAGALEVRLRAGAGHSVVSTHGNGRHSWSWPSATPRRLLDTDELRSAARAAGLRMKTSERVVDTRATAGVDALPLTIWLRKQAANVTKRLVPSLRDTLVATLTPFGSGRAFTRFGEALPLVTVVVLGDDADRALRIAGDLEEQTYPRERVEVLFATPGAAAANAALREARGEIVAFTDDWSRPPSGWVESGVRAMGEYTAALAGGVLAEQGSAVPFLAMPDRKLRVGGGGLYLAANSFYVRDAVLSVGGFDEKVGRAWGWDSTAAVRLRAAGFPIGEDETAFVFRNYPFPRDRSWIREEFERTRDLPFAVRRDPSLRMGALDHRYFASERTRAFDIALVGFSLAVVRRKPAYAVVGVLPWVRSVIEYVDVWPPTEWPTSVRNLRGIALRNAVWLAGLTVGSARARRVVL
jgi:hypothetical protein